LRTLPDSVAVFGIGKGDRNRKENEKDENLVWEKITQKVIFLTFPISRVVPNIVRIVCIGYVCEM